jgi:LmbE family N-acetylglucosaminyl deacetylase
MRILVFAPHPDDDVFCCGGSTVKLLRQGHEVATVYLTSGDGGSIKHSRDDIAKIREQEARDAAAVLGVNDLTFLRHPEGDIPHTRQSLEDIIGLIRSKKPHTVYLPHSHDGHFDHKQTHALVMDGINRAGGPWFRECGPQAWTVHSVLAYESWVPLQEVGYTEDISDFMDIKLKALAMHRSQTQDIQYGEAAQGLNRYRAVMFAKSEFCECFQVIRISANIEPEV